MKQQSVNRRASALKLIVLSSLLFLLSFNTAQTQSEVTLAPEVREFVSVDAPTVALTHARVIDGTGAAPKLDQTLIIARGQIQQAGPSASVQAPTAARVIDLQGKTVLPGFVLMHEHMFYPTGRLALFHEMG